MATSLLTDLDHQSNEPEYKSLDTVNAMKLRGQSGGAAAI